MKEQYMKRIMLMLIVALNIMSLKAMEDPSQNNDSICPVCFKQSSDFKLYYSFKNHLLSHKQPPDYTCQQCGVSTSIKSNFVKHIFRSEHFDKFSELKNKHDKNKSVTREEISNVIPIHHHTIDELIAMLTSVKDASKDNNSKPLKWKSHSFDNQKTDTETSEECISKKSDISFILNP